MNTKLIIPSLVLASIIGGATLVTANSALAESGLNKLTDSQQAVKAEERSLKMEEKLTAAVTDGVLTADQKVELEAKLAAIQDEREALRVSDATRDEMKTSMDQQRDDLKAWAEKNGLELRDVLPAPHHRGGPEGHERMNEE